MKGYTNSYSEGSFSNKKVIKFSQQQPSLNYQASVPLSKNEEPMSILKRRKYSVDQDDALQSNSNEIPLKHSQSEGKIITKREQFTFRIKGPPKMINSYFPEEPVNLEYNNIQKQQIKDNVAPFHQNYHIQQLQPGEKVPIWILVLIGIIVLTIFGWFISRMFFTKIKMSKHPQNAIFQRYLLNLTDYQVQKMQVYKPIILRQNLKWDFWRRRQTNNQKNTNPYFKNVINKTLSNRTEVQNITESNVNIKLKHLTKVN